jgi:hypothetical protein
MRTWQLLAVLGVAGTLFAAVAPGAEEGDDKRASTPPGISRDGSRPSEGAIKGGSLDTKKGSEGTAGAHVEIDRCRDLEGTLRTQCIEDARKKEAERPATQ